MNQFWQHKSLMGLTCIMLALAWTGCDDPEVAGNSDQNAEANTNEEQDNGTNQESNQNNESQENHNNQSANDNGGEGCDLEGFAAPDELFVEENARGWTLSADNGEQVLSLFMSHQGDSVAGGSIVFDDTPVDDQLDSLLMADDCTPSGCDTLFVATGGTLDISEWDMGSEGSFEAQLSDLELVEVVTTEEGLEYVDFGLTWCVDSLTVDASSEPMATFPDNLACERQDFQADDTAFSARAANDETLIVEALSSANEPQDIMSLQLYDGMISEGMHGLDDFNYASCEKCLLIYAGCQADSCEKIFIAGEGELEISSTGSADDGFVAGEQFTATLSDAKLVEVSIDPTSYDTEIVEGGESWCISQFGWSLEVGGPDQ